MFESMNIGDTKIGRLKFLMGHERPNLRDAGAVDVEVTSEIELVLAWTGTRRSGWHAAASAVIPHGRRNPAVTADGRGQKRFTSV